MPSSQTDRIDGPQSHLGIKAPCKAATTANITLSGEQTIDGVSIVTGDRVLVKNQTTATQNGIYVADSTAWERATDFDGNRDVTKGSFVYVTDGSTNGTGWFVLSTSDPIVIGTSSISFSRATINFVVRDSQTASAGQTVFNLSASYQVAANGIAVYVNGIRQRVDADYTETSATRITFTYGLQANDEVDSYLGQSIGNLTAASASLVAITDSNDLYIATTVEGALSERADTITVDVGDASVTLTWGSSASIQRWNTALTTNRTVTLSTTNAKEGARFVIVRDSGATGAFTLAVGSLVTLRVPGEWCEVVYDSGTTAWVRKSYGILPSAEILAMGSDAGDADATLTVGTSSRTQRWATALTADRTATLSTTSAYSGARFRIERLDSSTGNFALSVVVGSTTLVRLAPGQWCDVEYGTTWLLTAFGNLHQRNTSVVELADDFFGEEIDSFRWQGLVGTDVEALQPIIRADQVNGVIRLTTGDDAAATMAVNGSQLHSHLNWRANKGLLSCEFRVSIDTITSVAVFVGMTDQRSALEMPFTLAAGDALTSNATDGFGVLFDTAADTDNWWLVGVAADVDATKQNSAVAPVAGTFETWRIDVNASGTATFYRNGSVIGSALTGAVTASVALTPVVAAFSRTNASRNIDVDEIFVRQMR